MINLKYDADFNGDERKLYMGTAEINRKGPSVLNCFVVSNWFLNTSNPGCKCDK